MKVAYLILAHQNPRLLARVVSRLSSEGCAFFIHIDRKSDITPFLPISGANVFFAKDRLPVYWGEFSQVDATMLVLNDALASPVGYDYFVFLQGSDYPLRSGGYVQKFLETNLGYEFINLIEMPAAGYPLSKIRKLRYPSSKPLRRLASRALAKIGLAERDYRRSFNGLRPFAGQAWWALSRGACTYIVEAAQCNPGLRDYLQNTFTADEVFFHTLLGNSPFRRRRRSLMFVEPNWSITGENRHRVGDLHIRFFESQEKVWVEDEWGGGEVLFARKFSDDDLDLVDRVDAMIKCKEEQPGTHAPDTSS